MEEIDIQLAKGEEMQELRKLDNRTYQVLIKPSKEVKTYIVPPPIPIIITLKDTGLVTFYYFDERATNTSTPRVYESYQIIDID